MHLKQQEKERSGPVFSKRLQHILTPDWLNTEAWSAANASNYDALGTLEL